MHLNQVTLPAQDINVSVAFYKHLGFKQIVNTDHYARFVSPVGDTTFSLHACAGKPHNSAIIYFECDDLDEQVNYLKKSGIRFQQEPRDEPWLWREARLLDPTGNELCLYWAGENRLHPPWQCDS